MFTRLTCMLIFFYIFDVSPVEAQLVYYQDTFKGGVTGGGYNPSWTGDLAGEIELHIEPGSSIRKAILFVGVNHAADTSREVIVNGSPITLSATSGYLSLPYTFWGDQPSSMLFRSLIIDVTETVNFTTSGITTVTISPPSGQPFVSSGNGRYVEYYLFVAYNNENMEEVSTYILVNETNCAAVMNYTMETINPIDISQHMGLAVHGDHFCNTDFDGSYVSVNNQQIGLIGGKDENNIGACTGPTGTFYYQDQQLHGLSDDTANITMQGPDALADISSYLTDSNEFEVRFDYQIETPPNGPQSNLIWQLFFAYTSTCAAFETSLTERVKMCVNDSTIQLEATGGQSYEWWPADHLSCTDCPNPVYSGNTSTNYHVRIWNNDSCSKTLPVRIDVVDAPENVSIATTAATCSEADGIVAISNASGGQPPYEYFLNNDSTSNPSDELFSVLETGAYTLTIQDQNDCTLQQDFVIEEINPAYAAFSANPQSGTEPLSVEFYNQSSGTTHYEWSHGDSISNEVDFSYTFDSAGTYAVQLISWYNEPHCADTAMTTIVVHPTPPDYSHSIFTPTLYDPYIGDFFIDTRNVQRVEFELYNAIGQHIFSNTLDVADGKNYLWNGSNHARGYYFFRLKYWDVQGLEYKERGKVLLMR